MPKYQEVKTTPPQSTMTASRASNHRRNHSHWFTTHPQQAELVFRLGCPRCPLDGASILRLDFAAGSCAESHQDGQRSAVAEEPDAAVRHDRVRPAGVEAVEQKPPLVG